MTGRYLICVPSRGMMGYRPVRFCDSVEEAACHIAALNRNDYLHRRTPPRYFVRDMAGHVDVPARRPRAKRVCNCGSGMSGVHRAWCNTARPACRCRLPRRHRDCSYCGVTAHGEGRVCGVCREEGIDGTGTIRGTGRVVCAKHK
jgi:hypothetical protein